MANNTLINKEQITRLYIFTYIIIDSQDISLAETTSQETTKTKKLEKC